MPKGLCEVRMNQFYTNEDLRKILNVSRSRAYAIIKELNKELLEKGYIVAKPGQIQKSYADERLMLNEG